MQRVLTLREQCEAGVKFVKWLRDEVRPGVPASLADSVSTSADKMEITWPTSRIGGLESSSDFVAAMAYRISPPNELNDALIRAACRRLEQAYPHVRHAGTPDAKPDGKKGSRVQGVVPSLESRISELVKEEGVTLLLLPVNFGNAHWCGIMVHIKDKRIYCYDSLNTKQYKSSLERIASSIIDSALHSSTIVALNSPIQFDGFSCGFFVCMKFWRMVDRTVSNDMSELSLNARRFEFIHFVVTGMKPSVTDVTATADAPVNPAGAPSESCADLAPAFHGQTADEKRAGQTETLNAYDDKDRSSRVTPEVTVREGPVASGVASCTNPGQLGAQPLGELPPAQSDEFVHVMDRSAPATPDAIAPVDPVPAADESCANPVPPLGEQREPPSEELANGDERPSPVIADVEVQDNKTSAADVLTRAASVVESRETPAPGPQDQAQTTPVGFQS